MGRRKKNKKPFKPIVIIVLLLLIIGNFVMSKNSSNEVSAEDSSGSFNPLKWSRNQSNRTNILIFGVDATDSSNTQRKRADSIMILSVDKSGDNSILLSIPRDTMVEIPNRKAADKINHAHAYGGIELLTQTVENFMDMPIDYYVRVNYKAIEELVDALGGVEIDVPIDMKYSDPYDNPPLHIDIKKGLQVLDGKEALHFLRFRSGYPTQDLGRIQAQQNFAGVLMDKVSSPTIIFKAPRLINIFYNNVDTNMPKTRILYLGKKSLTGTFNNMEKITLPGSSRLVNRISYYVVEDKDLQHIREKLL